MTVEGLRVVEVAVGTSELGLGHAGAVPGWLLAELGADVTRLVGTTPVAIDAGVPWGRVWHRRKQIVRTDDPAELRERVRGADVAFVYGPEELVEGRGLGRDAMTRANPRLVHARCHGDHALLVEARSGFCSQLAAHRDGPMLVDARAASSGAALVLTVAAMALLRRRELTGAGGWTETSLHDGMLATLGCMIGRSERAAPKIEQYWREGSFFPNFLYRCGDGELLQVWFGGKGMYGAIIDVLGDEPSEEGYYAEQTNGGLQARAERWKAIFPTRTRAEWVERIRAAGVACEEVLGPGEALAEPHLSEVGLAVRDGGDVVAGSPIRVEPSAARVGDRPPAAGPRLLEGVKVADFSAFVAGPLAAEVLADLGAEVVKVEPPGGEAMRAAAYAVAACQRGKRSLALDIGAPEARPVVESLLGWADVVLHNFRVGVSERLGIDEATVAELNPGAVYCHASAFGPTGPRARYPGNDALMQALTGFEVAIGGRGNEPTAATWIPIDMTGGWVAAAGILAGLCARAATGRGQRVTTSLLGAGMLLHSGVFLRDGEVVRGPALDGDQTGYGPGYRLYRAGDGGWLALVVPDEAAWARLRSLVPDLPEGFAPLDGQPGATEAAEALEAAFAAAPAATWLERLRAESLAAEGVAELSRDEFRSRLLADPLRTASYETAEWGHFEQIGPLLRCGPDAEGGPRLMLPGVGQHTVEILTDLGVDAAAIDALLEAGVAHQGPPS